MGLLGFPLSVPLGGHEEMLQPCNIVDVGAGVRATFKALTGYEQFWRLDVDGVPQGQPTYSTAGKTIQLVGAYSNTDTQRIAAVCPQGDWATDEIDISAQLIHWQATRSNRLRAEVQTTPRFFSYGDSGQLTNWNITGLRRFINCAPVARRPQWGALDLTLGTTGLGHAINIRLNGILVAFGSRSGDGEVTLSEVNSSGISGTVDLAYTEDFTASAGAKLIASFPAQIKYHYRTSSFSGGDFPRTAEGTVYDDGRSNGFVHRSGALAAGTYHVVPHQVDENGNESTGTSSQTTTIYAPPEPAGVPAYADGDATDTEIEFAASATAGATYNIYDSGSTGLLDVETVAATHIAGTGTLTQTLADIGATFTGTRYVLVRAVSTAGVEEGSLNILELTYDNGARVALRPPAPGASANITTTGLELTVPYTIDTAEQKTAATHIRLFVYEVGDSASYGTPDASAAVGTAVGKIINGSIAFEVATEGVYYFELRTYSSTTELESDNTQVYGPVYLTEDAPDDPASVTVYTGV